MLNSFILQNERIWEVVIPLTNYKVKTKRRELLGFYDLNPITNKRNIYGSA
jgi:hypothetical protein